MLEFLFIRRVIDGISSQLSALADVPVGEKTPSFNTNLSIDSILTPALPISPQRGRCGDRSLPTLPTSQLKGSKQS